MSKPAENEPLLDTIDGPPADAAARSATPETPPFSPLAAYSGFAQAGEHGAPGASLPAAARPSTPSPAATPPACDCSQGVDALILELGLHTPGASVRSGDGADGTAAADGRPDHGSGTSSPGGATPDATAVSRELAFDHGDNVRVPDAKQAIDAAAADAAGPQQRYKERAGSPGHASDMDADDGTDAGDAGDAAAELLPASPPVKKLRQSPLLSPPPQADAAENQPPQPNAGDDVREGDARRACTPAGGGWPGDAEVDMQGLAEAEDEAAGAAQQQLAMHACVGGWGPLWLLALRRLTELRQRSGGAGAFACRDECLLEVREGIAQLCAAADGALLLCAPDAPPDAAPPKVEMVREHSLKDVEGGLGLRDTVAMNVVLGPDRNPASAPRPRAAQAARDADAGSAEELAAEADALGCSVGMCEEVRPRGPSWCMLHAVGGVPDAAVEVPL